MSDLMRQLSGEAELRASLAYALVLQQEDDDGDDAAGETTAQSAPQLFGRGGQSSAGPADDVLTPARRQAQHLRSCDGHRIHIEVHDAVDSDTAELAPETFTTTVAQPVPMEMQEELGAAGASGSVGPEKLPGEMLLPARMNIVVHCGGQSYSGLPARVFASESGWMRRAIFGSTKSELAEVQLPCVSNWVTASDGGVAAVMDWIAMQPSMFEDQEEPLYGGNMEGLADHNLHGLSIQDQQSAARVAYFLDMPTLLAVLLDILEKNLDAESWISTLLLSHDLDARRLRNACVRMGMVSLEHLPQVQLQGLPSNVQRQIRAIRGLRDASRRMGLGALAFDDAAEFIAMLRENVAYQKERIAEAENYESTHSSRGTPWLGVHTSTCNQPAGGAVWRPGCDILPIHAAQKRLAFAKVLLPRLANELNERTIDIDIDVAFSVCKLVRLPMINGKKVICCMSRPSKQLALGTVLDASRWYQQTVRRCC